MRLNNKHGKEKLQLAQTLVSAFRCKSKITINSGCQIPSVFSIGRSWILKKNNRMLFIKREYHTYIRFRMLYMWIYSSGCLKYMHGHCSVKPYCDAGHWKCIYFCESIFPPGTNICDDIAIRVWIASHNMFGILHISISRIKLSFDEYCITRSRGSTLASHTLERRKWQYSAPARCVCVRIPLERVFFA